MDIDFSKYDATTTDATPIGLSQLPLDEGHEITIDEVIEVGEASLLARVTTDLEGEIIWLFSAAFGPQNGFRSLSKAADGPANIGGKPFTYTRVSSEKSPVGYAHRWTIA